MGLARYQKRTNKVFAVPEDKLLIQLGKIEHILRLSAFLVDAREEILD